MPRNVRNFWIGANIDGNKSTLSGGPRSKEGGLDATIYMRRKGMVETAVRLNGSADEDGKLTLKVTVDGKPIVVESER